ncbi:hypothetical protein DRE_02705 [Drechslerella stenobrocha 248]|uniref:Beach-domain-containing protein n=1 Tax=Drechslerella stenobrocha 248 TaxID=1043628 RepID=W7HVB6_9PEZI|nr:hypothetical protein DRE_02705 [Drechslerella stenobrocha 248]
MSQVNGPPPPLPARTRGVSTSFALEQQRLAAEIDPVLQQISEPLQSVAVFSDRLLQLLQLRSSLKQLPDGSWQEVFRLLGGFDSLLQALTNVAGFYSLEEPEDVRLCLIDYLKCVLNLLSESLVGHAGNKRFFSKKVGFDALERGLAATGLPVSAPDYLFGLLFAFGMNDETFTTFIVRCRRELPEAPADLIPHVREKTKSAFSGNDLLRHNAILPVVVSFYKALELDRVTSTAVLQAILSLSLSNHYNLNEVHRSEILSTFILPSLWPSKTEDDELQSMFSEIAYSLIELGVNYPDDAKLIFRHAIDDPTAAKFLLHGLKKSRTPPLIQFDLSLHGYASVELAALGRSFPPSNNGYTLSLWVYIDNFDDSVHTTLFGIFDGSQKCFVLAYLEQDTHKLILQTSVSSSKGSIRFRNYVFEEKTWYHIVVAHRRGKATSAAKALLYVNGDFIEQSKCSYPSNPPSPQNTVQAFLGTPADLSPRIGHGVLSSKWSIANAYLFEDIISDDLIAVHYNLGPRYYGNFQDCLGGFQTYEASASLNMRNEVMHPGKEEKSDIISAIRQKASTVMPESKVLLNISATGVLDDTYNVPNDVRILTEKVSRQASKNLQSFVRKGPMSLNGAVPFISDALCVQQGTAIMTGDPVVLFPGSLDNAAWKIGGAAAVTLKLVEAAKTSQEVCTAVEILFETIKNNWRNSEAMERENGFGILAYLLRTKEIPGIVCIELLDLILNFVGYNADHPEESILINPLAYRVLLVDFELWRKADMPTQKAYFAQFIVFGSGSINHRFNAKRLLRMRIVKKLIHALKSDTFSMDVIPDFLAAFKSLINSNFSAETLRSLSLFITYALYSGRQVRGLRQKKSTMQLKRTDSDGYSPISSGRRIIDFALKRQVGLMMLEMYSELLCESSSTNNIMKFARTVTNRWLLYLLDDENPSVVACAIKILARILVVHGQNYIAKFGGKSAGFLVLKRRLRKWWRVPEIWMATFSVFLGVDIATIDLSEPLVLYHLVNTFKFDDKDGRFICPEMWAVVASMIKAAVNDINKSQQEAARLQASSRKRGFLNPDDVEKKHNRRRSLSLDTQLTLITLGDITKPIDRPSPDAEKMINSIVHFLADLQQNCQPFKEFCSGTVFLKEVFDILFPIICDTDQLSAETELDLTLADDAEDRLRSGSISQANILQATGSAVWSTVTDNTATRAIPFRRGSSFIIVDADGASSPTPSTARLQPAVNLTSIEIAKAKFSTVSNELVSSLVDIVVAVFKTMLLERREFAGFGLATKIPPGTLDQRIYFESYIVRNTLSLLKNDIALDLKLLTEPRILTNVGRMAYHLSQSIYEGWFATGAEQLLEFIGVVLEYIERPDISSIKGVRLCNQTVIGLRTAFTKLLWHRFSAILSIVEDGEAATVEFLQQLLIWNSIVLTTEPQDLDSIRILSYFLYVFLTDDKNSIRTISLQLLRLVIGRKNPEMTQILLGPKTPVELKPIMTDLLKISDLDDVQSLEWIEKHNSELDTFFFGVVAQTWDAYVLEENKRVKEAARARVTQRKDKLKGWALENINNEDAYNRHKSASTAWTSNIYAGEHLKYQRAYQDHQDNVAFMISVHTKLNRELQRPCGLLDNGEPPKWQLDVSEGRNRMRKRLLPDLRDQAREYGPKQRGAELASGASTANTPVSNTPVSNTPVSNTTPPPVVSMDDERLSLRPGNTYRESVTSLGGGDNMDDDFELVDDPKIDDEEYEDKNRKVLRSLQHGEVVQFVSNVSRVLGLSICEGLLILGRENLYMIDNFFQKEDGEIINVWQAPPSERDQYLQSIAGLDAEKSRSTSGEHEARQWAWRELLSVSKRKFLFRDVALELFFSDGRNYLLTTMTQEDRDILHSKLASRIPASQQLQPGARHNEEAWLVETMGQPATGLSPISFGGKLANVFLTATANPATKRWLKHEISNFHYLILVNAMAGRTFNDLTQYPVFPWVLADYTSEELDLTNPRTFRDFSKPMGAQTPERAREFQERYRAFQDLGDSKAPPFHYGTHYSSAMIVCSYLIRMHPFVDSYLLLQGGNFDHADRLFYSMEKAWMSASRDTTTDVRELIPEFFFLPEFLMNSNAFNFGHRQATGDAVDDVALPPWAKGDPKIFIAKHREALESPYVSEHLHDWIDLVFGYKQKGDAAVEATNVFHHLSYSGAIDLGSIIDPVERTAAIGIIHNFGQTPNQIFSRPHPQRENSVRNTSRLDGSVESLIRLPFPLLDTREKVHQISFSYRQGKVVPSSEFRIYIGPAFDRYLEWGYSDGGVRLYDAENRKMIALFEHLHQDQISSVLVVDESLFVTGGCDCTVSIWKMEILKTVDIHPTACLQGHCAAVVHLAVSRSFNLLVTGDSDGVILVWDLSRRTYIRKLATHESIQCITLNDVTGDILVSGPSDLTLYTLNGELVLYKSINEAAPDQTIVSTAFYEGLSNEWLERELIFTGHRRGIVNVWSKQIVDGKFDLMLVKSLQHINPYQTQATVSASITAILPMPRSVFTGDEWGRVYQWDCVSKVT